jgi:hypothetical protein
VRRFPYLLNQSPEDGDEVALAAQLEWKIIEDDIDKPFGASGLEFVPLPVRINAMKCSVDLVIFWRLKKIMVSLHRL